MRPLRKINKYMWWAESVRERECAMQLQHIVWGEKAILDLTNPHGNFIWFLLFCFFGCVFYFEFVFVPELKIYAILPGRIFITLGQFLNIYGRWEWPVWSIGCAVFYLFLFIFLLIFCCVFWMHGEHFRDKHISLNNPSIRSVRSMRHLRRHFGSITAL